MAKILLIETSTNVCSAAISVDGAVVAVSEDLETQNHAALLTLQIQACCQASGIALAELDAVAVSQGPGAYTALRVGASVAKGICYALDKPLIAVDTLGALAQETSKASQFPEGAAIFAPMLDARRQEVWLALYDARLQPIAPAQPLIIENNLFFNFVAEKTNTKDMPWVVLCGNGMDKVRSGQVFDKVVFSEMKKCSAPYLASLAERAFQAADFQDVAYFEPLYMKPPNITTPGKPVF